MYGSEIDDKKEYDKNKKTCEGTEEKSRPEILDNLRLMKGNQFLKYQFKGIYYKILYDDILFFNSNNKKIIITLISHEKRELNGQLKKLLPKLPAQFLKIHQSFVINQKYICKSDYKTIWMMDGSEFNVSQSNRKAVRKKIMEYNHLGN